MSQIDYFLLGYRGIPTGQRYLLNSKSVVKMGCNPQNDVRFQFADIAEFHIEIQWMGNRHELAVLGHNMKTLVNEQPVLPLTRHILKSGDMIQLGEAVSFQYITQPQSVIHPKNPQNFAQGGYPSNPQQGGYPNNPKTPAPGAMVVSQPAYLVPKEIPVIRVASLTHPTRIGCHFCLYTLDPNDPDRALRSFVKVGEHHYHLACYDNLNPKPDNAPTSVTIKPIEALEWRNLTPIVINPGPTNSIEDVPLGISAGTVTLNGMQPTDFYIRNNTAYPIAISRVDTVSWVYLHHHHPQVGYDFEYQLPPGDTLTVTIVPHAVHPSFVTKEVGILGSHVIDVASGSHSMSFLASLIAGTVAIFAHLSVLLVWSVTVDVWAMLFLHLMSSMLLVWWFIYMIPGRLLEISNRLMKIAFRLGNGVGRAVYKPIYRFITMGKLPTLMQNHGDYIGFSLVLALAVVGLIYIPVFGLMSLFPPLIRYLFSVGYLVVLVHIFNMIIYDYNDDPLYPTQRLWQSVKQIIREAQSLNGG